MDASISVASQAQRHVKINVAWGAEPILSTGFNINGDTTYTKGSRVTQPQGYMRNNVRVGD